MLLLVAILLLVAALVLLVRERFPKKTSAPRTPLAKGLAVNHPIIKPQPKSSPPNVNDAGAVEVCGFGRVSITDGDASGAFQQVGALTKAAGARWLLALQNSGDLRARAVGMFLEGKVTGAATTRPVADETRDAVAQLAVGDSDPAVYEMALVMCGTYSGTGSNGACQQVTLQHWAQLDPNNAIPWLLLAGDARQRHSVADEADAFSHAITATKMDAYTDSLYAVGQAELPPDVTPLERAFLATEVIGVEAAMWRPQYSVIAQHCSTDAMQDGKVRQQCNALAELLVTKGTHLLDLSFGKTLGSRAGWSSQRVNDLKEQQDASMQAIMQATPSEPEKTWTCEGVSRLNAYMDTVAGLGERGAAEELIERSGETVSQLALKYRQFLDGIQRDALKQELEHSPAAAE